MNELSLVRAPEMEEHVTTWGGGGNGQLQPGIVDIFLEFHVAVSIYIYLIALHVCNDGFINLHPLGKKFHER